jgi:hypothetical protein
MVVGAALLLSGVIQPPPATEQPVEVTETPTATPTRTPTETPTVTPTEGPWITIELADGCGKEYRAGDESRLTVQSNVGGPVKVWLDRKSIGGVVLKPGETWSRNWIFADMSLGEHEFRATLMSPEGSVLGEDTCPVTLLPTCIDFEDLALDTSYGEGETFTTADVEITVRDGEVAVLSEGRAGGSGNELDISYGEIAFDFGRPLSGLSLNYGEMAIVTPYVIIKINGESGGSVWLKDLDGRTIGDVDISIDDGSLDLDGTINSLSIDATELLLYIDDVCLR